MAAVDGKCLAAVLCNMGDKGSVAILAGVACLIHGLRKPVIVALEHRSHSRVYDPAHRLNSLIAEEYRSIKRDFSTHSLAAKQAIHTSPICHFISSS
jgi:hypothetical protein